MKVEAKREPEQFRPVVLSITLESEEELQAWLDVVGAECTTANAVADEYDYPQPRREAMKRLLRQLYTRGI